MTGNPGTEPGDSLPPDLESALALMRERVETERRLAEAKELEAEQLRRANLTAQRTEAWIRDLAAQAGRAVSEMRLARAEAKQAWERLEREVAALGEVVREVQEEQARSNDHVIDSLNRLRDAVGYLIRNGDKGGRGRDQLERLTDVPAYPEDREGYETIKAQLYLWRRNLNHTKEMIAKRGTADLELRNKLDEAEAEVARLEADLKRLRE